MEDFGPGVGHSRPVSSTPGNYSVFRLKQQWYVACASEDLQNKPLARSIFDQPIVLFRDSVGKAHALVDRCPHRNVPLSLGRIQQGQLECGYHGWRFDGQGHCQKIPGLCSDDTSAKGRNADAYPCQELDGWIWVWADTASTPDKAPYQVSELQDLEYDSVYLSVPMAASLHAVAENILDVPHTAFLHRGLFRKGKEQKIQVQLRRSGQQAEAKFIGESVPDGWLGRILAPGGGEIEHYDRFIMPCLAQVEYRLGSRNHVLITSALTPVSDFHTELFAVACFKTIAPRQAVKAALLPLAKRVLGQDQKMLAAQTERIRRLGRERFTSTEVDLLGPHISYLLRRAEQGKDAGEDFYREVSLMT